MMEELAIDDFCKVNPINEGSHGKVWEATYKGKPVALKVLKDKKHNFKDEVRIHKCLEHNRKKNPEEFKNVIQWYGCIGTPETAISLELCRGLDICDQILTDHKNGKLFGEKKAARIIMDIARALSALQKCDIIHCDLKSKNVVYADPECTEIKLIDFGFAKMTSDTKRTPRDAPGTTVYNSPQRKDPSHIITFADDVWSLGMTEHVTSANFGHVSLCCVCRCPYASRSVRYISS